MNATSSCCYDFYAFIPVKDNCYVCEGNKAKFWEKMREGKEYANEFNENDVITRGGFTPQQKDDITICHMLVWVILVRIKTQKL